MATHMNRVIRETLLALVTIGAPTLCTVGTPTIIGAQPHTVQRIASADVARALEQTSRTGAKGVMFSASKDGNAQFVMNRRTSDSEIELHCEWDDLLLVRSGAGVLRHSRKLQGLERYGWGEWRAARLVQPTEVNLSAGDLVRIPAGDAHMVRPLGDAPLVYLVVKVRSVARGVCGSLARDVPASQ